MDQPLVSIIILCFNHVKYVRKAIDSALSQTYHPLEIIVIDDGSNDDSQKVINKMASLHNLQTIFNSANLGNCRSFNKAFALSKGTYIIDLAGDDVLLPNRVTIGVNKFQRLPENFGMHFCDALLIGENGEPLKTHYSRNTDGDLLEYVPEGWLFKELVARYFICTPTMMFKRKVLEQLNGYDEELSFEDFDFWIRSSKICQYTFSNEVLVKKRTLNDSLSTKQRVFRNKHLTSTLVVCKKAFKLCETTEEFSALKKRIRYELKWALWTGNVRVASGFIRLYIKCTVF